MEDPLATVSLSLGMIFGIAMLAVMLRNSYKHRPFGLGGSVLTVFGVLLLSLPSWNTVDISISPQGGIKARFSGIEKKLEKIESTVRQPSQKIDNRVKDLQKNIIVQAAIQSCNVDLDLRCMNDGAVFGEDGTLARLKSCKNPEILRSDHPSLQWKDIWTTSVYSFQPGGGGPGGGRDDDVLKVGGWGDWYFSLIQFELPSLQRQPQFAALVLYSKETEGASVSLALDQIIHPWGFPKGGTLWWKDRPGHRAAIPESLPAPKREQWYIIEITGLFQDWSNRKIKNYGVQIRPAHDFGSFVFFVSSDTADKSKIPRLIFCS